MNKRISSILLCLVMVFSMLATAVFAYGVSAHPAVTLTIQPDKTEAHPGDTITYTITLSPVKELQTAEFFLIIPDGLTYVGGESPAGLAAKLNAVTAEFTSSTKAFNMGSTEKYTSDEPTLLATFTCTVNADAVGKSVAIALEDDWFFTDADEEDYEASLKSATVTITAAPKPATGIALNKSTLTLKAGATETLTATVTPTDSTDEVTWTSSDPEVARVDNTGLVTAVKKGSATITAKAGDQKATCAVTVSCAHSSTTVVAAEPSTCLVKGHGEYTKCNDCGEIVSGSAAELPLAGHTYGAWIDEVSATHSANGVKGHYTCSVCHKNFDAAKAELADLTISNAPHGTADSAWKFDETNHWHICAAEGCTEIVGTKAAHTFDWIIDTPATEESTGMKHEQCTVCHYAKAGVEIPKLDHVHTLQPTAAKLATCKEDGNIAYWTCSKCHKIYKDSTAANEISLAQTVISKDTVEHTWKDATCTAPKTCTVCGATTGDPAPHTPADGWKSDKDGHWKACKDCGTVIGEKIAHTPDRTEADYENPVLCTECDYEISPKRPDVDVTVTIPFSMTVKKTGEAAPGKETFKLGFAGMMPDGLKDFVAIVNDTIETNGEKTYTGEFVFTVKASKLRYISDGIQLTQIKGSAEGWTYDETLYYITFDMEDEKVSVRDVGVMGEGDEFIPLDPKADGSPLVAFTNSYSASLPTPPAPPVVKTGDAGVTVWLIALPVAALAAAAVVIGKKKAHQD